MAWPRMIRASSLKRKEIVRATSTGSMCRCNCALTSLGKHFAWRRVDQFAVGKRLHMPLLAGLRGVADDRAARARGDHRLRDETRRLVGAEQVHAEDPLP